MIKFNILLCLFVAAIFVAALSVEDSYGTPAFSRKYQTSCATCHYAFPQLNAFGKAFMNNGFRWPGGDSNYVKEEPVKLGGDVVWPSDMPGTVPLSINLNGLINYDAMSGTAKWNFNIPNYLKISSYGTLGSQFSFFGESGFANAGNAYTFIFTGFIQWDASPEFHIKAGEVRADPTPRVLKLTTNDYNIEDLTSRNGWSFSNPQFGIELWGALNGIGNHGGLTYRFGVVNGQGITSIKPTKDFYGKVTYKFCGLSETGVTKGVKSTATEPYMDNSLTIGGYFYKGIESGAVDEKLTILGGDIDLWFNRFIVNSSLMYMNSDEPANLYAGSGPNCKSIAYYVQTNGVIYPWLIGLVRYEWTRADIHSSDPAVMSIIPGITFLPRANIKLSLEAKKFLDKVNSKNTTFSLGIGFAM